MKNVPENELFSAYLDGELTADEQAQMDRLLATSAEARQLLDELRALSTTLQSLPAYKVGEDLGPRVLRAAERHILSGNADRPAPREAPEPAPVGWRPSLRGLLRRRGLAWASLAGIVALALLIFDRDRGGRRGDDNLAVLPPAREEEAPVEQPVIGPAPADRAPATPATTTPASPAPTGAEAMVRRAADRPAAGAAPAKAESAPWDAMSEKREESAEKKKPTRELADSVAANRAAPADDRRGGVASSTANVVRPAPETAPLSDAPMAAPAASTPGLGVARAEVSAAPAGPAPSAKPEAPRTAAESLARSMPRQAALADKDSSDGARGRREAKADRLAAESAQPTFGYEAARSPSEVPSRDHYLRPTGPLVVHLDVGAASTARAALEQILAKQNILLSATFRGSAVGGMAGAGGGRSDSVPPPTAEGRVTDKAPSVADARAPGQPGEGDPSPTAATLSREAKGAGPIVAEVAGDIVLTVEATPVQLRAALADLKGRPDLFTFVSEPEQPVAEGAAPARKAFKKSEAAPQQTVQAMQSGASSAPIAAPPSPPAPTKPGKAAPGGETAVQSEMEKGQAPSISGDFYAPGGQMQQIRSQPAQRVAPADQERIAGADSSSSVRSRTMPGSQIQERPTAQMGRAVRQYAQEPSPDAPQASQQAVPRSQALGQQLEQTEGMREQATAADQKPATVATDGQESKLQVRFVLRSASPTGSVAAGVAGAKPAKAKPAKVAEADAQPLPAAAAPTPRAAPPAGSPSK